MRRPYEPRPRQRRSEKDRALAQFRRYWEPPDLTRHEHKVDSVVAGAMKGLGLNDRFNEEQVYDAWNTMVNNFIATNARPVGLQKKVLTIQVLHSTVFYELERMKGGLLRKMQDQFGAENVREIKFRLG